MNAFDKIQKTKFSNNFDRSCFFTGSQFLIGAEISLQTSVDITVGNFLIIKAGKMPLLNSNSSSYPLYTTWNPILMFKNTVKLSERSPADSLLDGSTSRLVYTSIGSEASLTSLYIEKRRGQRNRNTCAHLP